MHSGEKLGFIVEVNVFSPNSELVTLHPPVFFFSADLNHFSSSASPLTVPTPNFILPLSSSLTFYPFYPPFISLPASLLEFSISSDTDASPSLPFSPFDCYHCYHCAPRVPLSPCLPISQSSNSLSTIVVNTTPPTTPHQPNQRRF